MNWNVCYRIGIWRFFRFWRSEIQRQSSLVAKGDGIFILPEFTVKKELKKEQLLEVRTDLPTVVMYSQLLYHKSKWVTQEMQKFIELVKDSSQTDKSE